MTPAGAPPPGGVLVTVAGGPVGLSSPSVGLGVGVMLGVQVAGNGIGGSRVQIGVGEPIVHFGHGTSRVGGTAVLEMVAPGPCGPVLTKIGGIVGLSLFFRTPCSAWA